MCCVGLYILDINRFNISPNYNNNIFFSDNSEWPSDITSQNPILTESAAELMEVFREKSNYEGVVSVYEAMKIRGVTPGARVGGDHIVLYYSSYIITGTDPIGKEPFRLSQGFQGRILRRIALALSYGIICNVAWCPMLIMLLKRSRLLILPYSSFSYARYLKHLQVYKTLMNSLYEDSVRRSEDLEIARGAEREKEKEKDVPLKQKSTSISNSQGMTSKEKNVMVISCLLFYSALLYSALLFPPYHFIWKILLSKQRSLGLIGIYFHIFVEIF